MKIPEKLLLSLVFFLITFIICGLAEISDAGENFSIHKLEIQLKSKETRIRINAALALGEIGESAKESIPELIELLNDEDKTVRSNTLYALKNIGGSERISTAQLIKLLKDPSKNVRSNTASVIAQIGEPARKAIPDLIKLLKDPDKDVRLNSVNALAQMTETGQESIPELVKILEGSDSNGSIRSNALAALEKLGGADKVSSSLLIKLLNDPNRNVRKNTIALLDDIKKPQKEVIIELIKVLKDPIRDVRSTAVAVMGNICECSMGKEVIPELTRLLKDPYKDVRSNAASALRKFGESAKEAIPQLLILLKETNGSAPENAAVALGNMGEFRKEIIPQLVRLLEKSNPKIRSNSVNALGKMGEAAIAIIPDLTKVIEDPDTEVSKGSTSALIEISDKLKEMKEFLSSSELDKAISGYEKALRLLINEKEQYNKINENLNALKDEQKHRLWNLFIDLAKKYPYFFGGLLALPVLLIVYCAILYFSPLLLLRIPSGVSIGKLKVSICLLKYRPRVLDAWVSKYLGSANTSGSTEQCGARLRFWKNATADLHNSSDYIPLPLRIETTSQSERYENLPLKLLQEIFTQNTARLLIYGEGGIGKTSLACKLADVAMAADPDQRLHKNRPLLPILIEPEQIEHELKLNKSTSIETTRQDGDSSYKTSNIVKNQPFIEAIRQQLQNLINEQSPIDDELLKQLLQSGHVLVIVDRFSEMSEDARQTVDPVSKTHPINALIVTSRKREKFSNFKMDLIEPLHLTGSELMRFMEAYFQKEKEISLGEQPSLHDACKNLEKIVKVHDERAIITVLLAKLSADQIFAGKTLPSSIPHLMIESLNLLNDQYDAREFKLDNSTICKSMRLIAWTCLQETLCPNAATLENITNVIEESGFKKEPHIILDYLVKLRVLERVGNEEEYIRIVHDPLAEYLAGCHLVEIYANKISEWKKFLERAGEFENIKTRGFRLAVYDCCRVANFENVVSLLEKSICKIVGSVK